MNNSEIPPILEAIARLDNFPAKGRRLKIDANSDQLQMMAKMLNVSDVATFKSEIHVASFKGGFRAVGWLEAHITQPCVVTMVPVEQKVAEQIDRVFLPEDQNKDEVGPGSELYVELEGEDLPDYYSTTQLDLSVLLMELLALGIDDFPRVPGAELENGRAGDDPAELSPFAALKKLKPNT